LIGEDEELSKARIIAEHIQKNRLQEIKPRYIQQKGWGGCSDSEEIYKILKRLEDHGILREQNPEKIKQNGRPASSFFQVNPKFKELSLSETSFKQGFVGSVGFVAGVENKYSNLEERGVANEF